VSKGAVVVPPTKKVGVLTALPLEYRASTTVCLAVTGAGNDAAAVITERAIDFFQPEAVFFTGIAGSLKADVSLAMYVDNVGAWAANLAQDSGGSAEVHFKPIVTGDVAVEMEAAGHRRSGVRDQTVHRQRRSARDRR